MSTPDLYGFLPRRPFLGAQKGVADYVTAFVYAQSAFNPILVTVWGKNAITVNGVRYETEPPRNKSLVEEFRKGQKVDGGLNPRDNLEDDDGQWLSVYVPTERR